MINLYSRQCLVLAVCCFFISSCKPTLSGQQTPQGYNCGNTNNSHCYAEGFLGDHLTGFRTSISIVRNMNGGDGFITNEFWLMNIDGNNGWIEIGYKDTRITGGDGTEYFWAALNPETSTFEHHEVGPIPDEEIGTRVVFDVHQIAEGTYSISITGIKTNFATTANINLWQGVSGGSINLGQELAGQKGAAASLTEFVENQIYNGASLRYADSTIDLVSERVDKPPYGGWLQKPAAINKGGVFSTYCCSQ